MKTNYYPKEAPRCICRYGSFLIKGSFTLEAAVVLALLACFFVSQLFFFRAMQVQLEVQKALDDTGRKLAVVLPLQEESMVDDVAGYVAAEILLKNELSKNKVTEQYVAGGILGVSLLGSEFDGEDVCLQASYRVRLPIYLITVPSAKVVLKAECRKWIGLTPKEETNGADVWVYITEYGSVYHTAKSCTYLTLSIRAVNQDEVLGLRNESGEKYSICILCKETETDRGRVYITNQGNRYHMDLNCSGIKRTIQMVRLSEVEGRPVCSKCSGDSK